MDNDQNTRKRGGCLPVLTAITVIIFLLLFLATQCSTPSDGDERTTVQIANEQAARELQEAQQRRDGERTDSNPVTGENGTSRGSVCHDGEKDGKSTNAQSILDIDSATISIEGDDLVIIVDMFATTLGKNSKVSGNLTLTSVEDPDLWVSYDTGQKLGGPRIGTDSKGDSGRQLLIDVLDKDTLWMSIPLEDFAELGDEFYWQVGLAAHLGPSDECPNEDRKLLASVSGLRD